MGFFYVAFYEIRNYSDELSIQDHFNTIFMHMNT